MLLSILAANTDLISYVTKKIMEIRFRLAAFFTYHPSFQEFRLAALPAPARSPLSLLY